MKKRNLALTFAVVSASAVLMTGCGPQCGEGSYPQAIDSSQFQDIAELRSGTVCLTKSESVVGFPFLGEYKYENAGEYGPPIVRLSESDGASGESVFQRHGVTEQRITWGVVTKNDGTPVKETGELGARFLLIWQVHEVGYKECTPGLICDPETDGVVLADDKGEWSAGNLTVRTDEGKIYILGERELDCPSCMAGE